MVKRNTETRRKTQTTNRSRAKKMRHEPVVMEDLFWSMVRNRRMGGLKFKRQVLIEPYIADFVCAEHMLIVELDGPLHAERQAYDAKRDAYLHRQGYRVLRFTNDDLARDVAVVRAIILNEIERAAPSP